MRQLSSVLEGVTSLAIVGHVKPDGDCVGASLGLYLYLKKYFSDIHTDIYLEKFSEVFRILDGTEEIRHTYDGSRKYDLCITVDTSTKERIGVDTGIFENAAKTYCIDHHISNPGYADENHIEGDASSASELVYSYMEEEKITTAVAAAIYTGIAHDTGVFQYSCTSPKTMEIAGKLIAKGIPFTRIVDHTFYEKTYIQNQILGRALLESMMLLEGKCIFTAVSRKDMEFYGVEPIDLDGIVSHLRMTKGVEVAIFVYETAPYTYKVSMRSNGKVDVSAVGAIFGGGGHKMAAGCTISGTIHDVINNISRYIAQQL